MRAAPEARVVPNFDRVQFRVERSIAQVWAAHNRGRWSASKGGLCKTMGAPNNALPQICVNTCVGLCRCLDRLEYERPKDASDSAGQRGGGGRGEGGGGCAVFAIKQNCCSWTMGRA